MSTLRCGLGALLFVVGCTPIDPAQNTFPQQQQTMSGPPGGGMDPGYGYAQPGYGYPQQQPQPVAYNGPDQPGYPQGYAPGYPDGTQPATEDQAADATANGDVQNVEPSADPSDAGYDMGQVDDTEIDATLDGYGSWEDTDDYGRVWRPDTTVVGVDFTPYETCGSWIWSDAGWNFSCDYSWGWLPFHYGRWGWFDGYWGWQPGYTWSSGAVEWRGGGGYTGWRPLAPIIRDHRGHDHLTPTFHDHRHEVIARDSQWRFTRDSDFGKGHIRGHLFQNPAEGLRLTASVSRPAIKANYAPVSSASIMRARLGSSYHRSLAVGGSRNPINGGARPAGSPGMRNEGTFGGYRNQPAIRNQAPIRGDTPTWRRPAETTYRAPQPAYRAPQQGYRAPQQTYRPTYRPPMNSGWSRPSGGGYQRPSYTPPSSSWSRSSGGGYQRPSYTPPSSSWSHSSGGGGGGWSHPSAPSRSSGGGGGSFSHSSGGGGGSFHSSGGGGGGGRHR